MKILFTQDALINAGSEKSHLEIISRFSEKTEASMVYFYPRHDLREEYIQAGIRLHFLDLKGSYDFINGVKKLVRLIREEKPDLLVSCLYRADIMTRIASKITGVPVVGTLVNDSYGEYSRKDKEGLKHSLVWLLDRWTAGIPIHWIANAKSLVDSHVKTLGLKREKISVVYRGRAVPRPRPVSPPTGINMFPRSVSQTETPLSSPTGIKNDEIMDCEDLPTGQAGTSHGIVVSSIRNFISYGRLLERKGFQEAIQAFSEVLKQYPDCTLTIYGEGAFRKNLEDLVLSLHLQTNVKLPGRVTDPTDLLTTANCFVFPSWYEGFSGALVEAMMAGIPIIASDIPMNLEAVTADINALTFPVKDVEALVRKMLYAIENPDKMAELGKAARLEAIERFDIEKIAKEYEGVLNLTQKIPHPGPLLKEKERFPDDIEK